MDAEKRGRRNFRRDQASAGRVGEIRASCKAIFKTTSSNAWCTFPAWFSFALASNLARVGRWPVLRD